MRESQHLKKQLEEIKSFLKKGLIDDAHRLLTSLSRDPDRNSLGQITALQQPRHLHSLFLKLAKYRQQKVEQAGYQYYLVPPIEKLNPLAQFTTHERGVISQQNRLPVPKVIHQIWIGNLTAPLGCQAWARHAEQHGYEYKLWDDKALQKLGYDRHPVYQAMLDRGDLPGAVDVARYLILQRFGGIYLDCDWYPSRHDISFEDFLPLIGLTVMAEDIPRKTGKGSLLLANSFIATPPEHLVFGRLLDALPTILTELPKGPAWWATGPLIFTLMARGGSVCLADAAIVAGKLPQSIGLEELENRCVEAIEKDEGLLLAWKSWHWDGY